MAQRIAPAGSLNWRNTLRYSALRFGPNGSSGSCALRNIISRRSKGTYGNGRSVLEGTDVFFDFLRLHPSGDFGSGFRTWWVYGCCCGSFGVDALRRLSIRDSRSCLVEPNDTPLVHSNGGLGLSRDLCLPCDHRRTSQAPRSSLMSPKTGISASRSMTPWQ